MKTIISKSVLIFLLFTATQTIAQTIEGDYGNEPFFEEIFINGLSIKPGRHISEAELKNAIEINPNRTDWGIGIDWNEVDIDSEESDYQGTLVTVYDYKYSSDNGFIIDVAGYENDYGFVPYFSVDTSKIVVGFLNHKFKIGETKKEDVEDLFYNGKIEKIYPNGYSDIKVFTHGGKLYFDFDPNQILQSIYLESF